MFVLNVAGWVITAGESFQYVPYNPDTADRAKRRTGYLQVAESGIDLEKKTVKTGRGNEGETFRITKAYSNDGGYELARA